MTGNFKILAKALVVFQLQVYKSTYGFFQHFFTNKNVQDMPPKLEHLYSDSKTDFNWFRKCL